MLESADPDLLLAVELHPKAADVIAARYPEHHLVPDRGYSGWGFASRHPMHVEAAKGWDRGGVATVETGDTTVHVAGVHILDPMHRPWRRTAAVRKRQVDALLAWGDVIPADEPQLVAGDFNATPVWSVYRRLAARWDDLVASGSPGTRPLRTWGIPRGPRVLRIDHVLGSGMLAKANRVLAVKGSDHAMVVVDLEFT